MRRDQFSLLLYFNFFFHSLCFLVAVLYKMLEIDSFIRPLDGVGHHVQEEGGQGQLHRVGEGPGGVDQHDVAAGQGGQTLVVAVLVQFTNLINCEVNGQR